MNYKDIYLDVYSEKAYVILILFRMWCRNHSSLVLHLESDFELGSPEIRPSNDIVWTVAETKHFKNSTCYNLGYNQKDVKKFLAKELKNCITLMFENKELSRQNWKRDSLMQIKQFSNNFSLGFFKKISYEITIADVFCLYDLLLETPDIHTLYPKKLLDSIRGVKLNPIEAELEAVKQYEFTMLGRNYTEELKQLEKRFEEKMFKMQEKIYEEQAEIKKIKEAEFIEQFNQLKNRIGEASPVITRFPKDKCLHDKFADLNIESRP